jgi:hypothetical protein
LLQKKVFFNLELDADYCGNIVITRPKEYWSSYTLLLNNKIEEKWPFPYVNNIHSCEYYLSYVRYIITFVLDEKYFLNEEYVIYLEFTKKSIIE